MRLPAEADLRLRRPFCRVCALSKAGRGCDAGIICGITSDSSAMCSGTLDAAAAAPLDEGAAVQGDAQTCE